MASNPTNSSIVVLRPSELATAVGVALCDHLESTLEDGRLTDDEIRSLRVYLNEVAATVQFPAVSFLLDEVNSVLNDGVISEKERTRLRAAILRVVPAQTRERHKAAVAVARAEDSGDREYARGRATIRQREFIPELGGHCPAEASEEEASQMIHDLLRSRATHAQKALIEDLGGYVTAGLTRTEASRAVDELSAVNATVRQRLVLRFWGREELANTGREAVTIWLDQFYAADPDRHSAWELWKQEVGDQGERDRNYIDLVPRGAGPAYLDRAKRIRLGDTSLQRQPPGCTWLAALALAIAASLLWQNM